MTRWPGKYVIGLTGNIATGKSVVRQMFEHLGAFSIDADTLANQITSKGGPAYAAVVENFGKWILKDEGEINRARLGRIVFSDPEALALLEKLVHPFVGQAIDFLVKRAKSNYAVIEAIKLIESGLAKDCNALWVVTASEAAQVARLIEKRKMPLEEARQRIAAQSPQADKAKVAQVVIDNSSAMEETWMQVQAAFNKISKPAAPPSTPPAPQPAATQAPAAQPAAQPATQPSTPPKPPTTPAGTATSAGNVKVRRGMPGDSANIATLIKTATNGARNLSRADVLGAFGDKAFFLADFDGQLVAVVGFKVENLVVRVDEIYLSDNALVDRIYPPLFEGVEEAARNLQCEAALLFVPNPVAGPATQALAGQNYAPQVAEKLGVAAWVEAARESMPPGTTMLFKKLREDRVLRPI
jgi:dephospho-CoA kinase